VSTLATLPMPANVKSEGTFPAGSYQWFVLVRDATSGSVSVDTVQTIVP